MSNAKPLTVHTEHTCTNKGLITFRLGNILIILFNQKIVVCQLSKVKACFVSVSQALKEIYTILFSWSRGKKRQCLECRMMLKMMLSLQENGFSHLNYFQRHTRKSWGISQKKKRKPIAFI